MPVLAAIERMDSSIPAFVTAMIKNREMATPFLLFRVAEV
jgi:hypothetical protein